MAHAEINYEPNPRSTEVIVPRRYGNLGNLHGDGDPNGVVYGRGGWSYYDDLSDDLYINTGSGYNSTWTLFAGGGGGGPDVKFGAFADPNGNVTGSVDDIYKSVESLGGDGTLWIKHTGSGDTGWI